MLILFSEEPMLSDKDATVKHKHGDTIKKNAQNHFCLTRTIKIAFIINFKLQTGCVWNDYIFLQKF